MSQSANPAMDRLGSCRPISRQSFSFEQFENRLPKRLLLLAVLYVPCCIFLLGRGTIIPETLEIIRVQFSVLLVVYQHGLWNLQSPIVVNVSA